MTVARSYVLDTNVFIEAAMRYYSFDIVPAFWQILVEQANRGRILSIDRVRDELKQGKDDLAIWSNSDFHGFFASTSEDDVIAAYRKIMAWSQGHPQFLESAKSEFASVADGWLVSYALARKCTVVTLEQLDPNIKRKIKIPNACQAFHVPYVDTFQMLRDLMVKLG
ncbi:MAG: DUF4411 family protein [Methanothrix sp.]|nr:DUF4411 family protein [Methanothrix sp.]